MKKNIKIIQSAFWEVFLFKRDVDEGIKRNNIQRCDDVATVPYLRQNYGNVY